MTGVRPSKNTLILIIENEHKFLFPHFAEIRYYFWIKRNYLNYELVYLKPEMENNEI